MPVKRIAILGSTGSIGRQCLEVVRSQPGRFSVVAITAASCSDTLISQALEFLPERVAIADVTQYSILKKALGHTTILTGAGDAALAEAAAASPSDMVVAAIVGFAGLKPVLEALNAGKHIALANKETLVVAGHWVMQLAQRNKVDILPVDSEHSAIFQCLQGELLNPVEKIILTGSGGPFRGMSRVELEKVTASEALKHPTWTMGAKITIDSASLMNKGLEVIEAKWLFGLSPDQIEVIIHPQSIIHSLVQFTDGSLKAQMGLPDMRLPIQYALGYPERLTSAFPRFSFTDYPALTFLKPDTALFPNLALAFRALNQGGNMPCILNAANEIAVHAFLNHQVSFMQMPEIIEHCMDHTGFIPDPGIDALIETDRHAREMAASRLRVQGPVFDIPSLQSENPKTEI